VGVHRAWITVEVLVVVLTGCHVADRSGTCAPIQSATRIVIHTGQGEPDRVVTDPGRILQLAAFANARRDVAQPRFYTMPAPAKTVTFYKGDEFVCSIGEGPNFFSAACPGWRGIRNAKPSEIRDFDRLIGDAK
jgi:hypothetical protein